MIYKKVTVSRLFDLMDACERLNIEFDVWDAESSLLGDTEPEFGVSAQDWQRLDANPSN